MSLKAELEMWASALKAYDEEDFEKSLETFSVRLPYLPVILSLTSGSSLLTLQKFSQTWVSSTPPLASTRLL
jgi:hypothetical protein